MDGNHIDRVAKPCKLVALMNVCSCLSIAGLAALVVSCDSMNGPISSGDFNPLGAPGSQRQPDAEATAHSGIQPGQFVQTAMNNTAFFRKRPEGNVSADKMLPGRTPMKVISVDGMYVKVELDSGEVGYVSQIAVADPGAGAAPMTGAAPGVNPSEYQVYPPLPGGAGGPAGTGALPNAGDVTPLPEPLPPSIDPEAPASPEIPPTPKPEAPHEPKKEGA